MSEKWLMSAERIAHLAAVGGANTIGLISIDGDAGVSSLSRLVCRVMSGGKGKALLVDLTGPVLDNAAGVEEPEDGPHAWQRTEAGETGYPEMAARPTTANRFAFNDVALLQQTWHDELRCHAKLVVDLPPVLHEREDLLSPLAAAASCDAVFLVCLQGRTAGWRLEEAVALLRAAHVKLAGVIVNGRDYDDGTDQPPVPALHDLPEGSIGRRLAQAAWRRRYLLLVPILLMLPLSVMAAKMLPVPYVARTLLLLQEPGIEGPAGTAFAVSERIEDRVPGLESLLKSHRVLSPVLADLGKAGLLPPDAEGDIEDLQERLSMKLVGLDMLEIELKGNAQQGLGRQLEEVVTRFLAALTTDQGAMTAGQLLVADSLAAWRRAEQAYTAAQARLSAISSESLREASGKIDALEQQLTAKRSELAGAESGSPTEDAPANEDRLVGEIAQLELESRELKELVAEHRRLVEQSPRLQAEVASAQQKYAAISEQYDKGAADYPQRLLDAPERIRIIDPPSDPLSPETSRLLYVVFGLAAGIFLGVGLAWGAEQADPSLRERREFADVAGVPVIAQLPSTVDRAAVKGRRWSLGLLALLAFAFLCFLVWLQIAPAEERAAITAVWEWLATEVGSWIGGATAFPSTLVETFLSPFR